MKPLCALVSLFIMSGSTGCTPPNSESFPDHDQWFDDVRWSHRLLVLSGTTDPAKEQIKLLIDHADAIRERDLLVINTALPEAQVEVGVSSDLPPSQQFRERFAIPTDTFSIVLVGKDGGVKERRAELFEPHEIFAIIDAMPMRIEEMRNQKSP